MCCAERMNLKIDDNEVVISPVTAAKKVQVVSQSVFLSGVGKERSVSVLEVKV